MKVWYTSYDYYANEYCGGAPVVDSTGFRKLLLEAQSLIDMYTFNRLKKMTEYGEEIQNCCCELVEIISDYQGRKNENPSNISSEKIKNYSVTYESSENISQRYESSKKKVIFKWLANSGLLYRGY